MVEEKKNITTMTFNFENIGILDKVIDDIFTSYQIMKLSHKENLYITDKLQAEIIKDIYTEVYTALSDDVFNNLSLIYKKEYIEDLLVKKVQMVVMNYTIAVNGNYKS